MAWPEIRTSSQHSLGLLSYLAVEEEEGSRADHHARAVWSLAPPHPGSLSYLVIVEEEGSRADHHARAVEVHHCPLQAHYLTWR